MLPNTILLSPTFSRSSSPHSRRGSMSPLPSVEGLTVDYKHTFLQISPSVSPSLPRSNSMPSLRLDDAASSAGGVYIEDLDLDDHTPYPHRPLLLTAVSTPAVGPTVLSLEHAIPPPSVPQVLCPTTDLADQGDEDTTVMLRNIPNKLAQLEIAEAINGRGFRGLYDFFYVPLDFKSRMNLGYSFINFRSGEAAGRFVQAMDGARLVDSFSTKLCGVSWARIQGLEANIKHWRNNPVNELPLEFRPCLFDDKGRQLPFPEPEICSGVHLPKASRLEKKRVITQTNKLFVGGLAPTTGSRDLEKHFGKFGNLVEAVVLFDKIKGVSKGFGFVTFHAEGAVKAALGNTVHWVDGVSVAVRHYTSSSPQQ